MLNFSSNLNIVQEPSISKFVTHNHNVTIVSSRAKNSFFFWARSQRGKEWWMAPQKNREILDDVIVRFLIQYGIMLFTN